MNSSNDSIPSRVARRRCSVALLVTGTHRRGAEVFAEQLAEGLIARDWDCDLIALKQSDTDAAISAEVVIQRSEPLTLSGLNPRVVWRLRALIKERRPAIVFAGGGATLKYAATALMGLRYGPSLIYSSIGEPEYWASSSLKRRLLTFLLGRADLISAVSQATADQLTRSFGVGDGKVRVAPTGVPDRFLEIYREPDSSQLHILFIGSLSSEKNPFAVVESHTRMSRPSLVRIVGDGPLLETVRSATSELAGVEVVGAVDDVAPHLKWADVLVITSRTEGLPGVALEAAAAGVPVVSFEVGGVSEIVEDGATGFLIRPGDIGGMAGALDRLADDSTLLQTMSDASRRVVRDRFLMSQSVQRYETILEELCAGAPSAS